MSLAHLTTGAFWIVFFLGAAWAAPTTPSSETQPKVERDSQMHNGLPKVKATSENNRTESAATTSGVEFTSEFPEVAECQNSWQKFMIDFNVHYSSEAETQKRRSIFCANWKGIQEHNVQYELGKVSFKKKINQWADLTIEEWKNKQRPNLAPEFPKAKPTTEASAVNQTRIKCEAAWKKFLTDFSRRYETDAETEKRRSIFCDNWKRIQEHNLQYEAGIVSHKKSINQWSDLTFEEWKKTQESKFPPNMETPGNKTEETEVHKDPARSPFPPNMEEPGTYIKKTKVDQKGINCQAAWEKFLVDFSRKYENDAEKEQRRSIFCDNWQRIQEHNTLYEAGKESYQKKINQWSDLTLEELKSQHRDTFPPNMEEPGTYIMKTEASKVDQKVINCQAAWEKFLTDFSRKYENDAETEKRRSIFCDNWKRIQEHNLQYEAGIVSHKKSINQWSDLTFEEWKKTQVSNFPPNMETPGIKTKATEEQGYSQGSGYTFPANMEKPGTYVAETTLKSISVNEEQPVETPSQTVNKTETFPVSGFPPNNEAPGTYLLVKEESGIGNKRIQCQAAWEKFLTDFSRKYENEAESEKRRSIFCDNWKRIQEHNLQYEAGNVSHKKSINQWADLTFEEWKKSQESKYPPNMETPGNKTETTEVHEYPEGTLFPPNMEEPSTYIQETTVEPKEPRNEELKKHGVNPNGIKCQSAWKKFLTDYSPKYENDAETEIRHSIFCDNWQRIQEHNALFKSGKVSHEESINQWSDLTSEELKSQSPNILPPNLRPSEDKRESTIVQVGSQQVWFPPNMEEPGIYVKETTEKPKLEEELTHEVPRIEEFKNTANTTKLPENKSEATSVEVGPQQVWFPANTEEAGTYLAKPAKKSESLSGELTDRVPSISN